MKLHIFEDMKCKVFLVSEWSSCPLGCISHGRWLLVAVTHFCHQLLRNLGKREATVRSLLLLPVALLHLWLMLMLLLIRYLRPSAFIHLCYLQTSVVLVQCTISRLFSNAGCRSFMLWKYRNLYFIIKKSPFILTFKISLARQNCKRSWENKTLC